MLIPRSPVHAVHATVPRGTLVIVVEDASPEPALARALDGMAARRRIRLLRHAVNRGFPAAANAGMRAAAALPGGPDVVLLNSDTLPAPGWIELLRAAVHGAADVGTATPLSNDASILSYPDPAKPASPPSPDTLAALAARAAEANPGVAVDIPTAVGFCMYVRRECLLQTGLFREDLFAQGYGEENAFCLRARHLGWRHVAVPAAYVAHVGGVSFGASRAHLMARNMRVLNRLHPGYDALIAEWSARDPLAPARRRLDAALWAEGRRRKGAVLLVTHDSGGGVERVVRARCDAIRAEGLRPIVIRPLRDASADRRSDDRFYVPGMCCVGEGSGGGYPALRFSVPEEVPALHDLLKDDRPLRMEIHHLLGHHHDSIFDLTRRLKLPYEVRVHDYAWLCPRVTLVGPERRYCGEPAVSACNDCVADAGSNLEEEITAAALRARSDADFAAARRVIAPSSDTAERLRRHFPRLSPVVEPLEDDVVPSPAAPPVAGSPRRICVPGAIGIEKGYDVLLACARDAAARDLPLEFVIVGHTTDDDRMLATGRVFITGPYAEREAQSLMRAQNAALAFLPSIWPETWCFTLGLAWSVGLSAVVFDIGAPAARVRATGRGWVLPLGLPANRINNTLLAARAGQTVV
jgi:GT2 family glycosyltransferase/glycosyltransferase involved in cell wall biosynthesis